MTGDRQSLLTIASGLAMAGAIIAPAWAAGWISSVEGPDIFGVVTVVTVVTEPLHDRALSVKCNTEGILKLAMISPAGPQEISTLGTDSTPAKLLIKVDDGDVKTFDAKFRAWNEKNVAVVVEGRTPDLIAAIRVIGGAKKSIDAGTELGNYRESAKFNPAGSTDAMKAVTDKCKLGGSG